MNRSPAGGWRAHGGPGRIRPFRLAAMSLLACSSLLAGCVAGPSPSAPAATGTPSASATPSAVPSQTSNATPVGSPQPTPSGAPNTTMDLRGTAWRLLELPGQALTASTTPTIEIAPFGRGELPGSPRAWSTGFDGCFDFGFSGTFENGRAELNLDSGSVGGGPPEPCGAAAIRDAFVGFLRSSTSWAVFGDVLVLSGSTGTLRFAREVPPPGDPGRALAEALRTDIWRIASATGINTPALYAPVRFSDRQFGGSGDCGFGGEIRFGTGGSVGVENAGFDTTFCSEADQRPVLLDLLGRVTRGALESADRVRLVAPAGEVVLARGLASTFSTQDSTIRFTADNGRGVTVDVRDGSGWLTKASKGTPFAVNDPSDLDVWSINAAGDAGAVRVEWVASGGCATDYRLTIEPDVRRIWIEQLTPPGSDSLGGNCDLTLQFSRPVPADRVAGYLLYPG